MDGRKNVRLGQTDGRTEERTDGRTDGRTETDGRTDGRTKGRTTGRTGGWTDSRTDRRADERTDGRIDELRKLAFCSEPRSSKRRMRSCSMRPSFCELSGHHCRNLNLYRSKLWSLHMQRPLQIVAPWSCLMARIGVPLLCFVAHLGGPCSRPGRASCLMSCRAGCHDLHCAWEACVFHSRHRNVMMAMRIGQFRTCAVHDIRSRRKACSLGSSSFLFLFFLFFFYLLPKPLLFQRERETERLRD